MKFTSLIFIFGVSIVALNAQLRAVTETGEEVILFEEGTWKYANHIGYEETETPTNPQPFTKDEESSFLVKSNILNVGVYINPKAWTFKKSSNNEDAEYEFGFKNGDLYGMFISEKFEIPLETLKSIAFENCVGMAPDLKIVQEEYRTVNGKKMLMLQMNGTTQGIKFSYYGYYFSNSNGTVQFVTYTAQNLIDTYISDIETLLNGFVELD